MPAESTPLTGAEKENPKGRVVGKQAWSPGFADCPFALAFVANVIFVLVFYFIWVGGGSQGWPSTDNINHGISNTTMDNLSDATVLTFTYSAIFALIWTFIYLVIMKLAAFYLIVGMAIVSIVLVATFGAIWLVYALNCKSYTGASYCSGDDQAWAWVGAICGLASAAFMTLWLVCIWGRIEFTAKMLSAVSGVLAICPGTVLVALVAAVITVIWWAMWCGALVQATIYLAGGDDEEIPYGSWIGLLFGMLISVWWGHKVFLNIAHMTSCHVVSDASPSLPAHAVSPGSPASPACVCASATLGPLARTRSGCAAGARGCRAATERGLHARAPADLLMVL